jgi:hypothetical protein
MPEITDTFFAENRGAWRNWLKRHGSSRQEIWLVLPKWVLDAKREQTRARRIRELVSRSARGQ